MYNVVCNGSLEQSRDVTGRKRQKVNKSSTPTFVRKDHSPETARAQRISGLNDVAGLVLKLKS
jgi:hypothetical protein